MWYYITFADYLIVPLYIFIFFLIVKGIAKRKYADDPFLKKKLIQGFWVKAIAAIAYSMFIQYYYGGGDSFRYFGYSNVMRDAISKDFSNIRFLYTSCENFYSYCYSLSEINEFSPANSILHSEGNVMIIRFTCLVSFLSFKKILVVSLFLSMFSYIGIWKMFEVFYKVFNSYKKEVAFSFLFLPSFWFWGSGILKETICLMALGFVIKHCYSFFIERKFRLGSLIKIFLFGAVIYITKIYIVAAFGLGFAIWIMASRLKKIGSSILNFLSIAALFGILIFAISSMAAGDSDSQEELLDQVDFYSSTYKNLAEESGSLAYTNIDIDPTPAGIVKKIPVVIMTIFFRPYVWEARSMILFISMIESCFFLFLFLKLLLMSRLFGFFKYLFSNPPLIFCLIMSLVMGLIVGFTTFNFGSIIRYKIPCMPFFCMMLLVSHTYLKRKKAASKNTQVITVNTVQSFQ